MPHLSAILSLKIASRKIFFKVGGFDFVFSPETRIAPSENALPYDQPASGAIIYSYVGGNPVNYSDPLGLWSVKGGFYTGGGWSGSFGYDQGQFFFRGGFGIGLGGGFKLYPNGNFPSSEGNGCGCGKRAFIGSSLSGGLSVGPYSGEAKGQAGWVITQNCEGKPQIEYIEDAPKFDWSRKFNKGGWGLGVGGGFNIVDGGVAW